MTKQGKARKLDESNGATFAARFGAEDWQRLRELRAALTTDVSTPTDADIVRFALRELHTHRAATRPPTKEPQ